MPEYPTRSETEATEDGRAETGWGSPMPARYGPLSVTPVPEDHLDRGSNGGARGAVDGDRQSNGSAPRGGGHRRRNSGGLAGRLNWLKDTAKATAKPLTQAKPSSAVPQPRPSWNDWVLDEEPPAAVSTPPQREQAVPRPVAQQQPAVPRPEAERPATEETPSVAARVSAVTSTTAATAAAVVEVAAAAAAVPARAVKEKLAPATARVEGGRTITHIDVGSVLKVSIVFYLIVLVVLVVASFLLWLVADAFGAVDSIQKSIKSLFDVKTYVLHPTTIAVYTSLAGLVLAVAGTIANVLAAVIYNLIHEIVGGIRVGVSDPESD